MSEEDSQSRAPSETAVNTGENAQSVPDVCPELIPSTGKHGTGLVVSSLKPQRANGKFLPGNTVSRRHGFYAARVNAELIAEREAFEAASLADDGGDVPVRRASRHRYRARLHTQIEALSNSLEHFGLFDRRNRLRTGWLQRLEALIGMAARLDVTLGDERRGRTVSGAGLAGFKQAWTGEARQATDALEGNGQETDR